MPILYTKTRPSSQRLPPGWWTADLFAVDQDYNSSLYDNLADELYPTDLSFPAIDVVKDFPWTLTPTTSEARKEAPYIYIREFLQLETQLNQSYRPYDKSIDILNPAATDDGTNPLPGLGDTIDVLGGLFERLDVNTTALYRGLFDHITPTYFTYRLPYFTPEYFNIQNTWEATDVLDKIIDVQTRIGGQLRNVVKTVVGEKSEGLGKLLEQLPAFFKKIERFNIEAGNPAVGLMDPPHVWKSAANRTYSFEFPLYNVSHIGNTNPQNLILKNWELCYLLTYQNLINKRNYFTGIPPVFYETYIPGIHYCKASYISDLTINNIGNIRLMQLPINGIDNCDVNVPDAYSIKITFTDLLQPSKNLLNAVVNTDLRGQIQAGGIDFLGGGI